YLAQKDPRPRYSGCTDAALNVKGGNPDRPAVDDYLAAPMLSQLGNTDVHLHHIDCRVTQFRARNGIKRNGPDDDATDPPADATLRHVWAGARLVRDGVERRDLPGADRPRPVRADASGGGHTAHHQCRLRGGLGRPYRGGNPRPRPSPAPRSGRCSPAYAG